MATNRAGNVVNYGELEAELSTITTAAEETKTNLDAMNRVISDAVGADGAAWSGDSAAAFRESWDGLAAEIPDFIQTVQNQVSNLESMLNKTKAIDTAADGKVEEV